MRQHLSGLEIVVIFWTNRFINCTETISLFIAQFGIVNTSTSWALEIQTIARAVTWMAFFEAK
jgi:hypothetical protein